MTRALAELARVALQGRHCWSRSYSYPSALAAMTTRWVGHRRRFEPESFFSKLRSMASSSRHCAEYGMQRLYPRLSGIGMRMLERHRQHAMWMYNKVFMPLGLLFQPKLR